MQSFVWTWSWKDYRLPISVENGAPLKRNLPPLLLEKASAQPASHTHLMANPLPETTPAQSPLWTHLMANHLLETIPAQLTKQTHLMASPLPETISALPS